nr:hypothetical protein [Kutzneria sp. 744]
MDLDAAVGRVAGEKVALFHAAELVGQAAAVPADGFGQGVLA